MHSDEAGILHSDDARLVMMQPIRFAEFNADNNAQSLARSPSVAFGQSVDRNPDDGYDPGYVATYVDDVLVFRRLDDDNPPQLERERELIRHFNATDTLGLPSPRVISYAERAVYST